MATIVAFASAAAPALAQEAPTPSAASKPPACASTAFHQFDFWLGDWDVRDASGKMVGQNRITRTAQGMRSLRELSRGRIQRFQPQRLRRGPQRLAPDLGGQRRRPAGHRRRPRGRQDDSVRRDGRCGKAWRQGRQSHQLAAAPRRPRTPALGDLGGQRQDVGDVVRRLLHAAEIAAMRAPGSRESRRVRVCINPASG